MQATQSHSPGSGSRNPRHHAILGTVLDDLRNNQLLYTQPAYVSLCQLATLDGKLSFNDAIDSLLPYEHALLLGLVGRSEHHITRSAPEHSRQENVIIVRYSSFGKVSLYPISESHYPPDEELVGVLCVEREVLQEAEHAAAVQMALEQESRKEFDNIVLRWHEAGEIPVRLRQVSRWINQFDALYTFVGRRLYSRATGAISTLADASVFENLASTNPSEWCAEDRLFIVAAQVLAASGGPMRLEEFNGKQLTAAVLRRWLEDRYRTYQDLIQPPSDAQKVRPDGLFDLAASVADMSRSVDATPWTRYRHINGITLVKTEHVLKREPALVATRSTKTAQDGNLERSLKDAARDGEAREIQDALESLLRSALCELSANFVMSSGIRDPKRLAPFADAFALGPMSLRKSDFYCCVLPGEQAANSLPQAELDGILLAIARRMEFNRWHFIPGNFPDENIPRDRHYFRPPVLPDLAEWSDLRHGGHVQAQVRHSVRFPGPPAWRAPLHIFGQAYRGIYDMRLFRTSGKPFDGDDLKAGLRYSEMLDCFMKIIYRRIESNVLRNFLIDRYTTNWYRQSCWRNSVSSVD